MGRNMLDTQRQLEEAEKKRMIEQMRREKSVKINSIDLREIS